ncbi:alcohol dehydrogenase [Nocardia donostiensis]|uniref:Alcohol dehydrogenase n=2 Tax=Nocardia donostiensis TaxID=1538463 RepID=A0A1V2TJD7_9NOCA|nr:NADP-dependent oxidoreductase [Nocardia donostiensis]ONM49639.1 alcohol dehydrogenase [Nocardia donostiensis]OQS13608.1 alcohol dehydrogenase [Nocardia donostiensis]OQS20007.1 alcohol dehydrogenase [Nocardia donostiensis]
MRAIVVRDFGATPEQADMPKPEPGPGAVLVRIEAAGVNPFDRKMADGILDGKLPHDFPMILGVDGAGTVVATGTGVSRFEIGQRVVGKFLTPPVGHGCFAEYAVVPEKATLVPIPEGVPIVTAAALPTAGVTAQDIVDAAAPQSGQLMLVVGATGGVGSFLVQLANLAGAQVIATARNDAADQMIRLGATETIDYRRAPITTALAAAHPEGIDILVDLVSPPEALAELTALVRDGGSVYSTVFAADEQALAARGITGGNIDSKGRAPELARLLNHVAEGDVVVPVETTVPLNEAAAVIAGRAANGPGARGKTVLTI